MGEATKSHLKGKKVLWIQGQVDPCGPFQSLPYQPHTIHSPPTSVPVAKVEFLLYW